MAVLHLVRIAHMAPGQLMPVHPPMPALQMTASSFGVVSRSFLLSFCTETRLRRSSLSWRKDTRFCSTCAMPGSFCSWLRMTFRRCCSSFSIVASPLRWSRVVMMRTRDSFWGRVCRNSSIRRVPIPSPRPLQAGQLSVAQADNGIHEPVGPSNHDIKAIVGCGRVFTVRHRR